MVEHKNHLYNASLVFHYQGVAQRILLLPGNPVTFGRDRSNDVRLALFPLEEVNFQWATADISRKHFSIRKDEQGFFLKDNTSTNGTSVDCVALHGQEILLEENQVIDVGGVLDLQVRLKEEVLILWRLTNTSEEAYLLFEHSFTIGSSPEATLCFSDCESILPCHARFVYKEGVYFVEECQSGGVTYLNNYKLVTGELQSLNRGDRVGIGNFDFTFL